MNKSKSGWFVYILSCADGTLYTGITTDLKRRVTQHNSKKGGAKYTRGRQPVNLVYFEEVASRSIACKRESYIKKLPLDHKCTLILTSFTDSADNLQ